MFRKLSWQLTTSFFVVILFSMALLGFFLLNRLDDVFTQDLEYSLHNEAQLVSTLVSQYIESNAGPDQQGKATRLNPADPLTQQQKRIVYQLAHVLTYEYGSRIRVLKSDGTVYIDTAGEAGVNLKLPEIVAAMRGEERTTTLEPDAESDPTRAVLAYPVRVWKPSRGGSRFAIAGVVYVTRSLDYLSKLLHDLRFNFIAGTMLSLVVTGGLGIFLSNLLATPLRKITAAAERMAQGDLSQMVRVRSGNEIGVLAQRFNYMASELRRRNSEVEEEKNKLTAVLTNMAGGALLISPKGGIVIKNRSAMELLGAQEENPDEDKLAPLMAIIEQAVLSGASGSQELRLPQGRVAQVAWTALRSEQELIGFVMVMNDITELRRIDEMRREFVTNVSHELRTPLASLKGLAEILLDGALKEEDGKRFLRSINREIDRLTRLVKDLLDLSKIESGLVKFEVREVDLQALVDDILQRMERRFDTVKLSSRLAPARVMADSDRVEQVVINLLDNALRHTPPGEGINIEIATEGDFQRVMIENVGSGIPPAELSRIFERFYRIDKHRSRDLGGTGLGLSISRHIVERLGGRIWAESNGRETRFIFTLPAAAAEVPAVS